MDSPWCKNDEEFRSCVSASQHSSINKSPCRNESRPCSMSGQSKHFQTRPFFTMRVATQPFPLLCPTGSAATRAGIPGQSRPCRRSREVQALSRNELSISARPIIRPGSADRSADVKQALCFSVELYPEAAYHSLTMNSTDNAPSLPSRRLQPPCRMRYRSEPEFPKTSAFLTNNLLPSDDALIGSK
jgi:hypothetical protein